MTTVLVTGGSGFLGSHVVEHALRHWEGLKEVRIFDLVPPTKEFLNSIASYKKENNGLRNQLVPKRVQYYSGDLLDMESLMEALKDVTIVFHCAAVIENGSYITRRKMYPCNVKGTQNVVEACLKSGVKALVSTGSVIQYLTQKCQIVDADESLDLPAFDKMVYKIYGSSKALAEQLVREANGRVGLGGVRLNSCTIRCPGMYGERENKIVLDTIKHSKRHCSYAFRIGEKRDTMQNMYVGNAAWAHLKAGQALLDDRQRAAVSGKAYFISDETPLATASDYMYFFLKDLRCKLTPFKVPIFLLLIISFVLETIALMLSYFNIDFQLNWYSRGAIGTLQCRYSFSRKQSEKDFGYAPLYEFEDARRRTVKYYKPIVLH